MKGYIDKISKDKDMVDCKPAMTPGSSNQSKTVMMKIWIQLKI
jgi:hypothetical protein